LKAYVYLSNKYKNKNMKTENLIYGLGAALVIVGALMKILHLTYGNQIFLLSLIGMIIFQSWHVTKLKKTIKDLETKSQ
jgi:hypothetical protein